VLEVHVHEDYMDDMFYNDVALLKVSVNTLEKMRFLLRRRFLNQDHKSDIMTHEYHYSNNVSSFCL
jgi:hypothetical protein